MVQGARPVRRLSVCAAALALVLAGCVTSGHQAPGAGGTGTPDRAEGAESVSDLQARKGGCPSVQLVERESGARAWSDSRMRAKPPQQVAVLPFWPTEKEFTGGAEPERASYLVTAAFRNRLSQLPFGDVERAAVIDALKNLPGKDLQPGDRIDKATALKIGRAVGADAVVLGRVKGVDQLFLVAYSQISVEVDLRMLDVASGCPRWRGKHVARGHHGGFTLDPVGTAFQVLKSLTSLNESNRLVVIDRLARELVDAIPAPEDAPEHFGPELLKAGMQPSGPWLGTRQTVTFEVHTDKPLTRGSVTLCDDLRIPLTPREPAQDSAPYVYVAERDLAGAERCPRSAVRVTGADADGYELDALFPGGRVGIDAERPARPGGMRTRYTDGKVRLAWDAADAPDVTGYVVERSASALDGFERVGTTKKQRFIDPDPLAPVGYYRVRARDRADQLSPTGEAHAVHAVEPGPTKVPETIESDTTWLAGASPYVLDGPVTVPRGVELTIQPGTTIAAKAAGRLKVRGRLIAEGRADRPIRFKPRGEADSWKGVAIVAGAGAPSRLRHVEVTGAATGITVKNADPRIRRATLTGNTVGLAVENNAYPKLAGSTLRNNAVGMKVAAADPKVVGNTFRLNSRVDVALDAAAPLLRENDFAKGAPTAVQVAGGMRSSIVEASRNWWGATRVAAIKDRLTGPVRFKPVLDAPPPGGQAVAPEGPVRKASASGGNAAGSGGSGGRDAGAGSGASGGSGTPVGDPDGVAQTTVQRLQRGIGAWKDGANNKALKLLAPLREKAKGNPSLQYALALLYFEDGRIEKAAAAAKAAVEANPMSVNFHRTHGMILMRQGRDDAARKALKRALELDESDVTARSLLERLAEQSV